MTTATQSETVLGVLRQRGPQGVTAFELLRDHHIYRAGARVWDLRHRHGYDIETAELKSRDGTARYRLVAGWVCIKCGTPLPSGVEPIPTAAEGIGRSRCWTPGCSKDSLFRRSGK